MSNLSNRAASLVCALGAAAALTLLAATPAAATAPHGSAKPITGGSDDSQLCDVTGLTYTFRLVNISQTRPGGTATPGSVTETWRRGSEFLTIHNANLFIESVTADGDVLTIHDVVRGLRQHVRTSDGVQQGLTEAGNLESTFTVDFSDPDNPVISSDVTVHGKQASADFCAVVDATFR